MDYEKAYKQYLRRCTWLENRNKKLEGEREGWMETLRANDALIAAVVESVGTVIVKKDAISRALKDDTKVLAHYDAEKDEFTMELWKPEENEVGE